ncbi:MAG TPA: formate/nitrite transporter family protein [Pseudolabrys sp.]|nr:formate/nitrite transporter family protein [Pseudolabrys sp.]
MAQRDTARRNGDNGGKKGGGSKKSTGRGKGISEREIEDVEEMSSPRSPVIYEVVRRLGDEEMQRPNTSLWWSGIAAGLSISFSLLAQTILETHLPDAPWRPLVSGFGYSVGFLMVILGRQQLFTESTITVVLPLLKDLTWANLWRMTRLWAIVLAANLIGSLFAALFCRYTPVLPDDLLHGMLLISRSLLKLTWWEMLFRGVSSGFLIAAMVWMIPSAESAKFAVITLMTYLIAIGGFTHIVAGSVEAFLLVLSGDWEWWRMILQFMAPVLIGNIVGGTALFAVISYAQVMEEI